MAISWEENLNSITNIIKSIIKYNVRFINILVLFVLFSNCTENNLTISIISDEQLGTTAEYGLSQLTDKLLFLNINYEIVGSLKEAQGETVIVVGLAYGEGLAGQLIHKEERQVPEIPEALTIWNTEWEDTPVLVVSGYDDQGLMYGLLDVAERISWSTNKNSPLSEVVNLTEEPYVVERGVSLYTMNRTYWESRFYDENYWAKYLDNLARNRFNSMVLVFGYENGGFLAPVYPYFFDVEEFPDVFIPNMTAEEQLRNLNALNSLIDMAHKRGIRFTVGIWDHIYRGGVQSGGIPQALNAPNQPTEHLVWGVTSENLISYTKAGMKKFIDLVPELDGIQLRMHWESGLTEEEQFTFFPEIFELVKEVSPSLRLDLRAKQLPDKVIQDAINSGVNFRIPTKFWMEQMGMPYHPTNTNPEREHRRHSYEDLLKYPQQYNLHWRLWNGGTNRILLWGNPEYVQRFAESTHLYDGEGFELNEPLATKMEAQPHDNEPFELLNSESRYYDYEFERYWHFFQTFGRLSYNPNTSPQLWENEFRRRFGAEAGPLIQEALHKSSWILPRIITSVYPYQLFPKTRGWAEKQRLGNLPSYARMNFSDMEQFASFDDEARLLIEGGEIAKILPSENSLWFKRQAEEIQTLITRAEHVVENNINQEFHSTIADLKILSNLALFHSRRIPAAVSYQIFERTGDITAFEQAIAHERNAINAWQNIVDAAGNIYTENLQLGACNLDLCGHWKDELIALKEDLNDLEYEKQNYNMPNDKIIPAPLFQVASNANATEMFEVNHYPIKNHPVGRPLTIRISVKSSAGIKWVQLRHRSVNQEHDYQTTKMHVSGGDNKTYEATIPADQLNPSWDYMYYFEIMDTNGNGAIYPDLNIQTPYHFIKLDR